MHNVHQGQTSAVATRADFKTSCQVQKHDNPAQEPKRKKKRDRSTEDAAPTTDPDLRVKAKKRKKDKKKEGNVVE